MENNEVKTEKYDVEYLISFIEGDEGSVLKSSIRIDGEDSALTYSNDSLDDVISKSNLIIKEKVGENAVINKSIFLESNLVSIILNNKAREVTSAIIDEVVSFSKNLSGSEEIINLTDEQKAYVHNGAIATNILIEKLKKLNG